MVADVPIQLSIYQGKLLRDIRKEILVRHYDVQIRQMQARWLDRSNVEAHVPLSNHAQVRGDCLSPKASDTFNWQWNHSSVRGLRARVHVGAECGPVATWPCLLKSASRQQNYSVTPIIHMPDPSTAIGQSPSNRGAIIPTLWPPVAIASAPSLVRFDTPCGTIPPPRSFATP